jgi:hypothetical protein
VLHYILAALRRIEHLLGIGRSTVISVPTIPTVKVE